MDCSNPPSTGSKDRNKRAATSPFVSPSHTAPVRRKYLNFHAAIDDTDFDDDDSVHASLADLPTTDNAVSGHMLKQMLLSLQKGIHKDIYRSIAHTQNQVDEFGDRNDRVERQLSDFTDAYN